MAAAVSAPLTWYIGDDETVELTICSDAAGTVPVNITGRTYTLSVATVRGATPVLALTGVVNGASGLVTFTATDTQTGGLEERQYEYDVVEVSGSTESTLVLSTVNVLQRVTTP